jgi:hypothetical protein
MVSQAVKLDEEYHLKATVWGVVIMALAIWININLKEYIPASSSALTSVMLFLTIALRFVTHLYVTTIATELNRNYLFWTIANIVSPGISLIIIGFLNFKIDNVEVKQIVAQIRLNYQTEKTYLKSKYDDSTVYQLELEKIQQYYSAKLKEAIDLVIAGKEVNISNNIVPEPTDNSQVAPASDLNEEKPVQYDTCPACNFKLSGTNKTCPDCGLSLN